MIVGLEDIFRIVARHAFACAHMFEHRLAIETPRILVVEPVGDISHRKDAVAAFERHWRDPFEIDGGHLLAFPKVADRRLAQRRVDLERHALDRRRRDPGPARVRAAPASRDRHGSRRRGFCASRATAPCIVAHR